ncbi:hypothetical protein NQ318_016004 [Aromia moschata]|uniref:Uncharacterized protein n=1 Tax=Aromia moschata TaxID=1265417 RepID=A0AAV8Y1S7_9CUCU|nr:hypothetical protein NQ318_016004 [Aromia moschata]
MFSISKLIVIMCLYNGLAAMDYLQCTENIQDFSDQGNNNDDKGLKQTSLKGSLEGSSNSQFIF